MSNWISSKLKVAESFLQQIDQQAAESLRKAETSSGGEPNIVDIPRSGDAVPLKYQLKKRTPDTDEIVGKSRIDYNLNPVSNRAQSNEIARPPVTPKSNMVDGDWTELLSSSDQSAPSTSSRGNGGSMVRGLRRDGRKPRSSSPHFTGSGAKKYQSINTSPHKSVRKLGLVSSGSLNGKTSIGEESREFSNHLSNGKFIEGQNTDCKAADMDTELDSKHFEKGVLVLSNNDEQNGVVDLNKNEVGLHSTDAPQEGVSPWVDKSHSLGPVLELDTVDEPKAARGDPVADDIKEDSSSSGNGSSDSEADSGSTSGSESEQEQELRRKRRQRIMAKRMKVKAVEAIKERENLVARLEGEKESLEKTIEERSKQQAKEASELQTTTMETMEAVEKEKQKHNNTRMELLSQLAKLEIANADLARSLASSQWSFEVQVNRVAELRQQMELKQAALDEIKRRISCINHTGTSSNQLAVLKGVAFEREILEAEYSCTTDKIERLKDMAKTLEENIEATQTEMENPTEVEVELKRRLSQLTDHLIQKQAQVEGLCSEKATLQLRIEATSRLVEEDLGSSGGEFDLESGKWERSKPGFEERIKSGGRQVDALFCAGAVFLRRNTAARLWSAVYLGCLHLWVVYILMSRSPAASELGSGAAISLENINITRP